MPGQRPGRAARGADSPARDRAARVPSLLALFGRDVPNLRIINLGGEMCPQALVERWATHERPLFNTYGPTEATVSASLARLVPGQLVTIGQPLPNYGLLVEVDPADMRLLPAGEVGELCIVGPAWPAAIWAALS